MSDEERDQPTTEGVRIIGAQEAAAIGAPGHEAPTEAAPDDAVEPDAFSRWSDDGPSWSSRDDVAVAEPAEGATAPELPHWSEPPTGQMPAVFASIDSGDDEDADAWSALGTNQPRFRADGGDWADADFASALADTNDEDLKGGALGEPEPDVAEDDDAFVQAVRDRRRSGGRPVVTSTPTPRAERPQRPLARRPGATGPGDMLPSGGMGSGRDLNIALLTAGVFALIAILCFALGQGATAALVAVVLGVCAFELCAALHEKGLRPATLVVVGACAAMPLVTFQDYRGLAPFPVMFTLVTLMSFLWFLWQASPGRPVVGVATSVLVFAYVGGLGGYAGVLLQAKHGVGLLLGTLIPVIAYDVFGYFAGSQFGSSPIAPNVSPNKTVEGTLVGVGAAVVAGAIALSILIPWKGESLAVRAAIGLLFGVAALLGDLSESLLKRDLGVKDFGTLLPGHGGFLDRFDGLLFALPVAYFLAVHLKLG